MARGRSGRAAWVAVRDLGNEPAWAGVRGGHLGMAAFARGRPGAGSFQWGATLGEAILLGLPGPARAIWAGIEGCQHRSGSGGVWLAALPRVTSIGSSIVAGCAARHGYIYTGCRMSMGSVRTTGMIDGLGHGSAMAMAAAATFAVAVAWPSPWPLPSPWPVGGAGPLAAATPWRTFWGLGHGRCWGAPSPPGVRFGTIIIV